METKAFYPMCAMFALSSVADAAVDKHDDFWKEKQAGATENTILGSNDMLCPLPDWCCDNQALEMGYIQLQKENQL